MKLRFLAFIVLLSLANNGAARSKWVNTPKTAAIVSTNFTLAWYDRNADGVIAGFKIKWGTVRGGSYSTKIDTHSLDLSYAFTNFTPGTYYFVVTSYRPNGVQSKPSNELKVTVNP
jgi:hypothetical protein